MSQILHSAFEKRGYKADSHKYEMVFSDRVLLYALSCAGTNHFCVWGCKGIDGVGLHGLVNKEQESSNDDQQEQLYPQRHATTCCRGLPYRGSCCQGLRGGGGGVRRGGGGQAADSVDHSTLCVGGGGGVDASFWRKVIVFVVPQVTGLRRATSGSSDRSPASGARTEKDRIVRMFSRSCRRLLKHCSFSFQLFPRLILE